MSDQIDILYKEKYNGAIIRARCDILTNNEDASSNFLRMEASNSKKLIIKEVKDKNGNLTKNSSETMQAGLDLKILMKILLSISLRICHRYPMI